MDETPTIEERLEVLEKLVLPKKGPSDEEINAKLLEYFTDWDGRSLQSILHNFENKDIAIAMYLFDESFAKSIHDNVSTTRWEHIISELLDEAHWYNEYTGQESRNKMYKYIMALWEMGEIRTHPLEIRFDHVADWEAIREEQKKRVAEKTKEAADWIDSMTWLNQTEEK